MDWNYPGQLSTRIAVKLIITNVYLRWPAMASDKTSTITRLINQVELNWLLCGISMAILPHAWHMPLWIVLISFYLIIWRFLISRGVWALSKSFSTFNHVLKFSLLLIGFVIVLIQYRTLVGRDAGSALLVILTGFKVLESRTDRDFYITVFLGFFVIITNFFYSQSISTAVFMMFNVIFLITALVTFNDKSKTLTSLNRFKKTASMVFQSLPLMLVIFLLFPRVEGPLWGMPKDTHAGLIGLSDSMQPGSISQLIKSDEVAFRVKFNSKPPRHNQLYWRGPVFWHTDGTTWTSEKVNHFSADVIETSGVPVDYAITLEPHNKHWLFALEMPENISRAGFISYDYQFRSYKRVRTRLRYEVESYTDYTLRNFNRYELQRGLQLPLNAHQKAIALAKLWRTESGNDEEIINRALSLFKDEDFFYTLTPPLLAVDTVDEFLFQTRQGFCEHYASAFVILMRAAGIPSRVVTGYQGGSFNPVGEYFNVYQRDAHAWAEVWMNDKGWVRIDPTSVVSPLRVEGGIENALPRSVNRVPSLFGQNDLYRTAWLKLQNTWDALNNEWNQWFISYGPERQLEFLQSIGLESLKFWKLGLLLVSIVFLVLVITGLWLIYQGRIKRDQASDAYARFCRKMSSIGIHRLPSEGPVNFSERANRQFPELQGIVTDITISYTNTRYTDPQSDPEKLRKLVNNFNPVQILKNSSR